MLTTTTKIEGPNEKKLREWYEKETAENGLLDVKFFPISERADGTKPTLEEVCGEVLEIINALPCQRGRLNIPMTDDELRASLGE